MHAQLPTSVRSALAVAFNRLAHDEYHERLIKKIDQETSSPSAREMTAVQIGALTCHVAEAWVHPSVVRAVQELKDTLHFEASVEMVIETLLSCQNVVRWHTDKHVVRAKTMGALHHFAMEIQSLLRLKEASRAGNPEKTMEYIWQTAVLNAVRVRS